MELKPMLNSGELVLNQVLIVPFMELKQLQDSKMKTESQS